MVKQTQVAKQGQLNHQDQQQILVMDLLLEEQEVVVR